MLEVGCRRVNHLLRSQHAPRMSAHTVGHHRQRHTAALGMGKERNAILLFLTIALMLGDAGVDHYGHASGVKST